MHVLKQKYDHRGALAVLETVYFLKPCKYRFTELAQLLWPSASDLLVMDFHFSQ